MFYVHGINYYNIDKDASTRHAEVDAVNRLKFNRNAKPKKINLLVIRTNNKGDCFMMAKSCPNCMKYMKQQLFFKNYKVHKAWYSNNDGNFTCFNIN